MNRFNNEVSQLLDQLEHPLREEIDRLRKEILLANSALVETIKWNGPNYSYKKEDRITMRVQPSKRLQLIFHRGVKVLEQPPNLLINDNSGLLSWKTNDRAVASFKNKEDVGVNKSALKIIINEWLAAAQ